MFMIIRYFLYIFATVAIIGGLLACNSSTDPYSDVPPELPPAEAMQMGFTLFSDSQNLDLNFTDEFGGDTNMETPYSNFLQASVRAIAINGVLAANTALPVSVLASAELIEPELNENGDWEWNYTVDAFNRTANVRFTGSDEDGQVRWNVYITQSDLNINNQLLFTGLSSPDNSSGSWTYFDPAAGSDSTEQISELMWSYAGSEDYSLQLEILTDRNNKFGDILSTSQTGSVKQAAYTDAGDNTHTEVEWDGDTNEGFLISPKYNSGVKACWNQMFVNSSCVDDTD